MSDFLRAESSYSPDDFYRIFPEDSVSGDNGDFLDHALRYDKAVEGIAVVQRKTFDTEHVFRAYIKEGDPVHPQLLQQKIRNRLRNFELADANLDRDFPQACDAQEQAVVLPEKRLRGVFPQLPVAGDAPEERVGVEQDPHGM